MRNFSEYGADANVTVKIGPFEDDGEGILLLIKKDGNWEAKAIRKDLPKVFGH